MSRALEDLVEGARTLATRFLAECEGRNIPVFITSTLRAFHEQGRLYAQGRTAPGSIVTNERGGESRHNHGLAFDVAFRTPPAQSPFGDENPWEEIGAIGRGLGLEWGGDWPGFRDRPHFQLPSPYSVRTLRAATIGRFRRSARRGGGGRAVAATLQRPLSGGSAGSMGSSTAATRFCTLAAAGRAVTRAGPTSRRG